MASKAPDPSEVIVKSEPTDFDNTNTDARATDGDLSHTNVSSQLDAMEIEGGQAQAGLPPGAAPPKWTPTSLQEGDDPVVLEAPVYLANTDDGELVVLQYPTRRGNSIGADARVAEIQIKPRTKFIEASVGSALPRTLLDETKASCWGGGGTISFGGILKPAGGRYAVTVWDENGLHLSLVTQTAQLQPQFDPLYEEAAEEKSNREARISQAGPRAVHMSARTAAEQAIKLSEVYEYWREATAEPFRYFKTDSKGGFDSLPTHHLDSLEIDSLRIKD